MTVDKQDVIERAIVAHGEIWPPTDERQMMEAAIRVVLEDFRSHIGAGSVCQSVLRDYAASIGVKLAPDQPVNPEDWPLQSEAT